LRARSNRPSDCPYVGKGGLKLEFALREFGVDVAGLTTADLGCHIGGFTDCLLQAGAAKVHAVDTGYGVLAWKLRQDERVELFQRTNALHWQPPEALDLVAVDVGWTRQEKILPAAAAMVRPGDLILSLVKPQYEAPRRWRRRGVLLPERLPEVMDLVRRALPPGLALEAEADSPVRGSGGNVEFWLKLRRRAE